MAGRVIGGGVALGAAGLAAQAVATGGLIGDWTLDVVETRAPSSPGARGVLSALELSVALLTDMHHPQAGVGSARIRAQLQQWTPDLIVLGGDVITHPLGIPHIASYAGLPSRFGTIAVLGNHEFQGFAGNRRATHTALESAYAAAGIRLLRNDRSPVWMSPSGQPFQVLGFDDHIEGVPQYDRIFETDGIPARQLVLAHCPIAFQAAGLAAVTVPRPALGGHVVSGLVGARGAGVIMLSGHTHGGQVCSPRGAHLPHKGDGPYSAGWYHGADGAQLYVSRGLGYSVLPIRLFARPELTLLRL